MIISLGGKAGVGKDLVGKIIQYLIWMDDFLEDDPNWEQEYNTKILSEDSFNSWLDQADHDIGTWKIKKFADPLKDMVCILLGCSRQDLEDEEFKRSQLGEEWWHYDAYAEDRDGNGRTFLFPFLPYRYLDEEDVFNLLPSKYQDSFECVLCKMTPRLLLQLLGTDCVRNIIHPSAWVNALFRKYDVGLMSTGLAVIDFSEKPKVVSQTDSNVIEYANWIITDLRFPNELEAIKDREGITIRVDRPTGTVYTSPVELNVGDKFELEGILVEVVSLSNYKNSYIISRVEKHESETALDHIELDYHILNDGSVTDLIVKVDAILRKAKIIE